MAYVFDPINNTLIDDEDKSLGNKLALNDDEFQKLLDIPGVFRASEAPQPPERPDVKEIEAINRFVKENPRDDKAKGGRINQNTGTNVMTLNPLFPEKDPTDFDSFKPLDVPGMALPVGATLGGMRLKDIFFSKDKDDKKDLEQSDDKNNLIKGDGPDEPDPLDDLAQSYLIDEAVERLKKKEMDVDKRTDKTLLARDLDLDIPKSGLYDLRKDEAFFNKRLKFLQKKGVNFDGYYSTSEIANLLGIKTGSGVRDFIIRKNVPMVKKGLFNVVKLNDFLKFYEPTRERILEAPDENVRTKARNNFLSEVGGSIYQKFKDLRVPKNLPEDVKQVYTKYNLTEVEGGHPFPVEFFTKKYGKGNTLQDKRQFDWIYRNKDKLFDKDNLVFQSKDVNTLFRDSINQLKKQYEILSPLVDKYEGKGAVKNKNDIATIEAANNAIMEIVAKSQFDARKFIEDNPNSVNVSRMEEGGLYGALFNTDTGEVSLYAPGKETGFVKGAVGEDKVDSKLKLAGDYLNIISKVITDKNDKKIFTDYINEKLLPRFQKGGGVEITPLPRSNFGNGGAAGADIDFATELEYFLTNPNAELPAIQSYKETKNPIEIFNDIINPRNYPYYADVLARAGIRVGEFGVRILPATGKLISDIIQKGAFKVKGTEDNYVRDYLDPPPPSNIKGTGIFSEFLENITPTTLEKKVGLDTLIKKEEQRLKDTGSTVGPKVFADTLGLGTEVAAPIFPGLKLLRAYAKKNNLPVNDVTQKLLVKEIDQVLDSRGMNRREFLQVTGAGATVILAKMLGFGDEFARTAKVTEKIAEKAATTGGVPPYFFQLVEKIKRNGKKLEPEYDPRVENNMTYGGYDMKENMATGEITITKSTEGEFAGPNDKMYSGVMSDEIITYKPGETVLGKDGKYYRTSDEYEEFTAKPDEDGKMKDTEPSLDSIEDIIELLGPNKLKMSELENAGYNVNAFPDNIKRLLIDDLQKTN